MAPTVEERRLRVLIAKKEKLFEFIQNLYDLSGRLSEERARVRFLSLIGSLGETKAELMSLVDEVNMLQLELDEKAKPNFDILDSVHEMCGLILIAEKSLKTSVSEGVEVRGAEGGSGPSPRLPKIELPTFSGNIREWEQFYELFKSLVHENPKLSKADKFYYLMGCLKDQARSIGSGLSMSAENYEVVWDMLIQRYHDTRALANAYLGQLLDWRDSREESEKGLNSFLENYVPAVRALRNLKLRDLGDYMFLYHALSRLNAETVNYFEINRSSDSVPQFEELLDFVKLRVKMLATSKVRVPGKVKEWDGPKSKSSPKAFLVNEENLAESSARCGYCGRSGHEPSECKGFLSLKPYTRYDKVKEFNLCYNCLAKDHGVRSCPSPSKCDLCPYKHHKLIHRGQSVSVPANPSPKNKEGERVSLYSIGFGDVAKEATVLLGTAEVEVNGPLRCCKGRFLLDSGSQLNLITRKFVRRLGLTISKCASSVQGLGGLSQPVVGLANFSVVSTVERSVSVPVSALVVERITGVLPHSPVQLSDDSWLRNVALADMNFNRPGQIDGLLGAEIFAMILGSNHVKGPGKGLVAMDTSLGYVVMGRGAVQRESSNQIACLATLEAPSVEEMVKKFWELESVPEAKGSSPDDDHCERMFKKEAFRDDTGRFTVALPFKLEPSSLGDSRGMARRRFFALESRLKNNEDLKQGYHKAMRDFVDQGHIYPITEGSEATPTYYIPHHAVYKVTSQSTPVRIVLDASAPSDNGLSLNAILHMGPKLQADLGALLMRFRLFSVAMVADIRQMYRQINVVRHHRKFQRIFWRWSPEEPLGTWELRTLAFGVTSSPYLAQRCVQELLQQEEQVYPKSAALIRESLYMDDLVVSVPTVREAEVLYEESVDLLGKGQFELKKWATNSEEFLEKIPAHNRINGGTSQKGEDKINILGLSWDPVDDTIWVTFPAPQQGCTKRSILSSVARCFDPIGLSAPLTLHLKLLVKELWQLKLDWDEAAPRSIQHRWKKIQTEWPELQKLRIRRNSDAAPGTSVRLLGFADACKDGYGGVVYLQSKDVRTQLQLVCAKSRVSPVKLISIPRLELCAALLLTKLMVYVMEVLGKKINISETFAFSDSSTVVQWLNSDELKDTFVRNRVGRIKELLPLTIWSHIPGKVNPADGLSRGLSPSQLVNHESWFQGPSWAKQPEEEWPGMRIGSTSEGLKALMAVRTEPEELEIHPLLKLVERKSSWVEILRITVWVLRWGKRIPKAATISASDLQTAERILVILVQRKHFGEDMRLLQEGKEPSHRLRSLQPFLHDGALRVGGRLTNSSLAFENRHPWILPKGECLTERIIDHYHLKYLHTGSYLLEALLRRKFWILAGRSLIKKRVRACNKCFRVDPKPVEPLMASLPEQRVSPSRAFSETGVDYFGPINITLGRRRGSTAVKAYVALFVCMSVKAIHLELVSSLSTEHFLQAFKRFLSRRGSCKTLYSDRGTNFVGARRVLSEVGTLVQSKEYQDAIGRELAERRIQWKFNPPAAPHMGGIWESQVKVVKRHLTRVIGEQLLSYEELNTLLVQVEALLNSRPLCQLSADPAAPAALTPAHFLQTSPLEGLPADDLLDVKTGRLNRFQLLDQMVQSFWKRWKLEYLTTLQTRHRWTQKTDNLRVGTVVVLRVESTPPLKWPLAVITEVFPGRDGVVRTVKLRCGQKDLVRPAVKVCPLPTQ